ERDGAPGGRGGAFEAFDPRHPIRRQRLPSLAGDLDTVVLEALHKDPERRYSSARALADEIERFLGGEPVLARPVGAMERLVRKVRRHRRAAAALTVALGLLAALGAVAVHARWTAGRRAATAQRFGQEVERIDAMLQRTFMAPLHDVRPELEQVRSRMAAIEDEMQRLDGASRAIGHYALGRGHLGLGEEEEARAHLEQAWEAGYTEPRVAYALGMALTRLYRQALDDLVGVRMAELREKRQREIETELRRPAIRALEAAGGDAAESELVSAALEFCGGELASATLRLGALTQVAPWFYEADLLAGDIFVEMETVASREGRIDDARRAQEEALSAFRRAVDVGRSDQRGHEGLCKLGEHVLWREFLGERAGVEELREQALTACRRAIEVNPDRTLGHLRIAYIERRWADHQLQAGLDPRSTLETGMRHAQIAAGLARPGDSRPWVALAGLHRVGGTHAASRGEDPTQAYSAAVAALEKGIEVEPRNAGSLVSLCLAELYFGDFERRRGGDAERHFENAVAAGLRAAKQVPEYFGGHANLGLAYEQLGILRRDRGADATEMFAASEASFRRAIELNPGFLGTPFNLGQVLVERAEFELDRGADPTALVREAQPWLDKVLAAWPKLALAYTIQARGEALLARWAMERGEDPRAALTRAREWAERGTAIGSGDAEDLAHAARIALLEARWRQERSIEPQAQIAAALDLLDRGLEKNPNLATLHQLRARALWLRARQTVAAGSDPRPAIKSGLAAAQAAVERNPKAAETALEVARLRALRAAWLEARAQDAAPAAATARAAAERSLELRPGYRVAQELLQELMGRARG
ncbi:MAG: hypothetical protein KDD11_17320, partial [Acidobacteria bacterium]|nr:hypothetical protein [Acidobacteriota bacterium]